MRRWTHLIKWWAGERSVHFARNAVQILGGYGFTKEYAVERHYRDVRVTRIYEGTSEIQRIVIARAALAADDA